MRFDLVHLAALAQICAHIQALSRSEHLHSPVWSRCQAISQEGSSNTHSLDDSSDLVLPRKRDLNYITSIDSSNPIQAAKYVQAIPYISNNSSGVTDFNDQIVSGDSDEAQLPWNNATYFHPTANTNVTAAGGWQAIPQVEGFNLNRSWEVETGAIMPFYITAGVDNAAIKRAVITWPGKPRDSWKYANLYRNALEVVYANSTYGVTNGSVLIVSPVWMNQLDQEGGAVLTNEIYFNNSGWQSGHNSVGPSTLAHRIPSYTIMDNFTDMLFDNVTYPNLNQVVIAGHSMGGQAAHRYAVLKKQKRYDDNMSYWVGNPGSWTYLSPQRPYWNISCVDTFDNWQYGIGGNTTKIDKYARADVIANKTAVVQRYLARKVHMALGLLDNGAGDTHCSAQDQGGNHLDRGSQYVLHLANLTGGSFPSAQTVDFIGNTSHQDYAMISTNTSLNWLFANDYNTRYPDIVSSNPGDKPKKPTATPRAFATHGNIELASSLLGGSVLFVIMAFSVLPLLFRANYVDEELEKKALLDKRSYWTSS